MSAAPDPSGTDVQASTEGTDRCTLCDASTPTPPVTGQDVDGVFCCAGCREVYRTLGDMKPEEARAVRQRLEGSVDGDGTVPDHADEVFLHVSGMHCTACEAFLEGVAEREEGIYRAEASYASEMVRVHYDSDQQSETSLSSLLTRGGYAASVNRDRGEAETNTVARLLIGGFFSMMVMLWYVVFFYPVYAGGEGLVPLDGDFGRYALGNVWVATTVVLGVTGWPLFRSAGVSLRVLRPNMDLLVVIAAASAYLYSTGAVLLGQVEVYFDVAVVIIFVVTLGRWFESRVKGRATDLLADLTREQVETAKRLDPNGTAEVDVQELVGGDVVRVRRGERVPVDGTVAEGTATLDESLLTGEARPVTKTPGDDVIGGSVVQTNVIDVRVGSESQSTLDRLVRLMWEIQAATPGVQQVADRVASVFVPLVLVLGIVAVGFQLFVGATWPYALLSGLTVLIVSCPCALGLATPLAVAAGTRAGLERRIVVKHAGVFEKVEDLAMVIFDKTGTLTTGEMEVLETYGEDETLGWARAVEERSVHPVGQAVARSGSVPDVEVDDVQTQPRGITGRIAGRRIFVGHPDVHTSTGGTLPDGLERHIDDAVADARVPVLVAVDGEAMGLFVVGDSVRTEADRVLDRLDKWVRIAVCTGDHEQAAGPLRADRRIDEVVTDARPEAKRALLQQWRAEHGAVMMVGDGSNDAPALADADLGIAFGPTAIAADSADIVILDDDLSRLPDVLSLARATRRRIRQNLWWAFGYNAVAIPLAIVGWLNPLAAALAMATSSLLVVGNSARSLPIQSNSEADV